MFLIFLRFHSTIIFSHINKSVNKLDMIVKKIDKHTQYSSNVSS